MNLKNNKKPNESIDYLRARDEAQDNTRIVKYIFLLVGGFLIALFVTYFLPHDGENEPLLSSNLVHFVAGSLFTCIGVIVDRYFKTGTQKDVEKNLEFLVKKLMNEEGVEEVEDALEIEDALENKKEK